MSITILRPSRSSPLGTSRRWSPSGSTPPERVPSVPAVVCRSGSAPVVRPWHRSAAMAASGSAGKPRGEMGSPVIYTTNAIESLNSVE